MPTIDLEGFLADRCACTAAHAVTGTCAEHAGHLVRVGNADVPMCMACIAAAPPSDNRPRLQGITITAPSGRASESEKRYRRRTGQGP